MPVEAYIPPSNKLLHAKAEDHAQLITTISWAHRNNPYTNWLPKWEQLAIRILTLTPPVVGVDLSILSYRAVPLPSWVEASMKKSNLVTGGFICWFRFRRVLCIQESFRVQKSIALQPLALQKLTEFTDSQFTYPSTNERVPRHQVKSTCLRTDVLVCCLLTVCKYSYYCYYCYHLQSATITD